MTERVDDGALEHSPDRVGSTRRVRVFDWRALAAVPFASRNLVGSTPNCRRARPSNIHMSLWRCVTDLGRDLRHAGRIMRRNVGVSAVMILVSAVGIGGGTTVFSLVDALAIQPLPFKAPEQLVWVSNTGDNGEEWSTQVDHVVDVRTAATSLSDVGGWGTYRAGDLELTGTGEPERLTGVPVTQNFFALLGVQPAFGRWFTPEECQHRLRAPTAVMLTASVWRRRFASDPAILGRTLTLNNRPLTVVGVLPASFDFSSMFAPGITVDVFLPWPLTEETNRQGNTMKVIARLKPGTSMQAAQAEVTRLGGQMNHDHPERNVFRPKLMALDDRVEGAVRAPLGLIAAAVGMLMLIVCANLSNLQLVRMNARRREMAVRTALGAGRSRLVTQLLIESIVISMCGAVLGVALAFLGVRALAGLEGFDLPRLSRAAVDHRAIIASVVAAVGTGILFGLTPALGVGDDGLETILKETTRGSSEGRRTAWTRHVLVVAEIALSCVLVVAAALLSQSLLHAAKVNLGFQRAHVATLRIDPSFRIASFAQQNAYLDDLLQRVRTTPGVSAAGVTDLLPFGGERAWQVSGKGQIYANHQMPGAFVRVVTDGYFAALQIPIVAGRAFSDRDRVSSEPIVIVNQTLARTLWPHQDAVGQVMTQDGGRRVIGVVADVRHQSVEQPGGAEMYLPMRQTSDYSSMQLAVRSEQPLDVLRTSLTPALRAIDPNVPVQQIGTLDHLVDRSISPRRFFAFLVAGFAAFAMLLAALGVYAVISQSVNERAPEMAIRLALGASPVSLQTRILLWALKLSVVGVTLGAVLSMLATRIARSLLFGVSPTDRAVFGLVSALLMAVALAAALLPARRAARIDPIATLRSS
jgi:predicted permease